MSRIVTLVCVLFLVGYCLVSSGLAEPERAAIARKPRYSWRHTDSFLALLNHERIVWQFNFDKKEGKPYFHPVGLIDGTELTWLRPADHRWHRALWFSWKYINGLNYWEEDAKTGLSEGRTAVVEVKFWWHNDWSADIGVMHRSVDIEMMLSYHRPGEPAVLTEKRLIAVSAPDKNGRYIIDWYSSFIAGDKDVLLDRTPIPGEEGGKGYGGYAGLSVRMAKTTRGWQFVDSEGRKDKEAHGKRARWVDFSGEIGGDKAAGVTIFDHPDNLRHPSPWYVEKGMPYFSPAVLFNKSYTLSGGKSLTLWYRILIHPGRADRDMLKSEWKAFLGTSYIELRTESAEKLKKLGLAVAMYAADHNSKLPDTLQKLKPYVMNEQDFQWLLDNVKYVGRGKLWQQFNASKIPIAYDRTLLEETYDTNVLFDDGHVRFNTFRQLEKLGIRDEIIVHVESAKKLSDLGKAIVIFTDEHEGKLPDSLQGFAPYLRNRRDIKWLIENVEYLGKGKTERDRPDTVIAYDRTLLDLGNGTNVLFLDSHIAFLGPKRLEKLGIKVRKTAIRVDLLVCEVYADKRIDAATFSKVKDLIGERIESGSVANLPDKVLRAAVQSEQVPKDKLDSLVCLLGSRGYLKILMNPTLEVVDGQTGKVRASYKGPAGKDIVDSFEVTPRMLDDGCISLETEAAIGEMRITNDENRFKNGQSLVIGGIRKTLKRREQRVTETMFIVTATICEGDESGL